PTRFPRPAWYQATATWTRPWKKSRSSAGAARHASSSASCAAKNSPPRISSSPRASSSEIDPDLAVLDRDQVGLELDRAVELVLAGADVVLPAMPRTSEYVAVEPSLAQRRLQVDAVAVHRVHVVADAGERDVLLADPDARQGAGSDLVQAGDNFVLRHALDPSGGRCYVCARGDIPPGGGRPLLPGKDRGAPARAPPDHDRQRRSARARRL